IAPTSHAVNTVLSQKRFGGAACTPKHSLYWSAPTSCQCCPFSRRSRSRAGILSHRPDRTR
ncbi:hypothetical protein E8Y37_RS26625, partial [Escherichia coli]